MKHYENKQSNPIRIDYCSRSGLTGLGIRSGIVKFSTHSCGIRTATQGQFSIEDRDANTPYIKR